MTKKKPTRGAEPTTVDASNPKDWQGRQKIVGGSQSDKWNNVLVNQAVSSLWTGTSDEETLDRQRTATVAGLLGISPGDELEGMMAAQLLAAHNAVMECHRRAMLHEQTAQTRQENLSQANKLSRTYATLLETLQKYRGKGQQKVTVEHVHVHSGGRAVVGMVGSPGGGDRAKSEDQPHAKQIAHAPEPALRSPHQKRDAVPVSSNGERPLPNARGKVTRSTEGQ